MKNTDIYCPICGHLNKNLQLEDTNGWLTCGKCGNTVQLLAYEKKKQIPVYTLEQIARRVAARLPL